MDDAKQERVTCECGQCEVVTIHEAPTTIMGVYCAGRNTDAWVWRAGTPQAVSCVFADDNDDADEKIVAHCISCGARLSFDSSGNPVARRMVPEEETREEFLARARERGPLDFDTMRMDISDEEMAALGELPEREVMVPKARADILRRIAERSGEATAYECGCPLTEKCAPPTAPCQAVTADPGTDEWDEQMEAACPIVDDEWSLRALAGRCWVDVWEHEEGLPWPEHDDAEEAESDG